MTKKLKERQDIELSKVCVFFGTGYEEIEALAVVDLLRRVSVDTDMVSITGERSVTGSHGIAVGMDKLLSEVDFDAVDMIVLPGGMPGTKNLEACGALMEQVDAFVAAGKPVCAICAAPSILGHRGHLEGKKATAYPSFEEHLTGAQVVREPAVRDGHIITGRGMGCAVEFGLAIVEYLKGTEAKEKLADAVIFNK